MTSQEIADTVVGRNIITGRYVSPTSVLPPAPADWQRARLPDLYLAAKTALSNCNRVDEVLEWKRRAEAFAAYYRMAQDQSLRNLAVRIRLRAIRRCGELYEGSADNNRLPRIAPTDAHFAREFSKIPEAAFERIIHRDPIPTQTEIAKHGANPGYMGPPEISERFADNPRALNAAEIAYMIARTWRHKRHVPNTREVLDLLPRRMHSKRHIAEWNNNRHEIASWLVDLASLIRDTLLEEEERG